MIRKMTKKNQEIRSKRASKVSKMVVFLSTLLTSCGTNINFKIESPPKIKIDKPLNLSIKKSDKVELDSVHFYLDGKRVQEKNIDLKSYKLGKHLISAHCFYQEKTKKINRAIYFLSMKKPKIYKYEILNTYPHNTNHFTQGLTYHKGFLYETTGEKGKSKLIKTDLETGKILMEQKLPNTYFGEGMTILSNKVYWLTWHAKKGFIYDLKTFKKIGSFDYLKSKEGWGLTHDETSLLKTDGSEHIWFLDPKDLKERYKISAYTDQRKVEQLNEIEYIEGKIYANIWQKETIVIINPKNGSLDGIINLKGIKKHITAQQKDSGHVLNGIAYDSEHKRLFITGKNWDKIFEIKIVE